MSVRVPKYRLHKATGQALVEIRGRRTYLASTTAPEVMNDTGRSLPN